MKSVKTHGAKLASAGMLAIISAAGFLAPASASADILNASSGIGTFTINFDREAFAVLQGGSSASPGLFNAHFYDGAASDPTNPLNEMNNLLYGAAPYSEQSSTNLVHGLSAVAPASQATDRYVQGTTSNFEVVTSGSSVTGGAGSLGMTGVQVLGIGAGTYAGYALAYGDYSLVYDPTAQAEEADFMGGSTTGLSGWYLQNHIGGLSFFIDAYDIANLSVVANDANNWKMTGDILMSASNVFMLGGNQGDDMGNFCLGVGSYSGCSASVSEVPVPGAVWMFGTGILGMMGAARRKLRVLA